ncbi:TPA: hypothetical protein MED72_006003 [Klebsiella variicola]|nr:hypothetical protein [Klebsiella variicola]HBW0893432.1 hypothetical protein [Klebsiella variicola]
MTWYFYELPKDNYKLPLFAANTTGESGYIATTEADDFNQAALQFAQWLNENGHGTSGGYTVINKG